MNEPQIGRVTRIGTYLTEDGVESGTVTYQVTANSVIVAEFGNGYDAGEFARKFFTTRAASGKVVTIKRSDGKPVA